MKEFCDFTWYRGGERHQCIKLRHDSAPHVCECGERKMQEIKQAHDAKGEQK